MIRGLLKLVLLIVVIAVAGAFLLGWWGGRIGSNDGPQQTVGTSGVDEKARAAADKTAQVADRAGEQAAIAADRTKKAIAEGSLTAKIKAKMALDDHVKALDLNVDTVGTVVTVSGVVKSQTEKDRALQLARDTAGVTQVVDKIQIR
jgi:osmotically-inducible protein OsmY